MSKSVVWVLIMAVLVLAGCGKSEQSSDKASIKPPLLVLGNISFTVEENRFPFLLREGSQRYKHAESVTVQVIDTAQDNKPVIWEGQASEFEDSEGPYYVIYPAITRSGLWNFEFDIQLTNGKTYSTNQVVNALSMPIGLTAGQTAIPSDSLTAAGLDKLYGVITTDSTPNLAYYQMTIAQAVTSGRPSIIVFATPELCTRSLCNSVLESLDPIYVQFQDHFNFVHVETYNLETGKKVPAIVEWGLEENPWFYLIDSDGTIVYRCEGIFSAEELTPVIENYLGDGV